MKMIGYKGFDKDLKCIDFQYEVGKEYEHEGKVELCRSGFHFCENPQGVFGHYAPGSGNRFAIVEADEVSDERESDSKRVAKKLKIKSEISVFDMCRIAVDIFFENFGFKKKIESAKTNRAGDYGAASAGYKGAARAGDSGAARAGYKGAASAGDYGAARAGDSGAARAGDYGAASAGDYGAASAGYKGAASAGDYGAASAGDYGAARAGDYGAASAGYKGAASAGYKGAARAGDSGAARAGDYGAARAGYKGAARAGDYGAARAGYKGAASAGDYGAAEVGRFGVAVTGNSGRVKGRKGSVLVAREIKYNNDRQEYEVADWACALVDGEEIKEDTWYVLKDGKLVGEEK